jgi:hypothetical protein
MAWLDGRSPLEWTHPGSGKKSFCTQLGTDFPLIKPRIYRNRSSLSAIIEGVLIKIRAHTNAKPSAGK